jgi:uncharacterized protein YcfJ
MKALILTTAMVAFAGAASADQVRATVEDVYSTRTIETPYTTQECRTVSVPVYGQGQASSGDALVGAIIGGVVGNQIGSGSGRDAATVLGAIVGADMANKRGSSQIVGYRDERQCADIVRYNTEQVEAYSHSVVTFESDGQVYTFEFVK